MSITIRASKANPADHNIELVVEVVSPTVLAVRAGTFTYERTQYALDEDQEWTLPVIPDGGMWVEGYLVVEKATGDVHVLVDEQTSGAEHYEFDGASTFTLLNNLFSLNIPESTVSLAGLAVEVFHIIPRPAED